MSDKAAPEKPPLEGQFRKGQSGNPKGRPKSGTELGTSVFDVVIEKKLMITRNGVPREITMEEALQHRTYQNAIAGNLTAQRDVLKWIDKREKYQNANAKRKKPHLVMKRISPDPANADTALLLLGIAALNPRREDIPPDRAQMLLEPWAVQAALSRRRGSNGLKEKDVSEIRRCVSNPESLRWPKGMLE